MLRLQRAVRPQAAVPGQWRCPTQLTWSDITDTGLIMWKYGTSPYHNRTDKNWVNVKDTTWTDIIAPEGKKYNSRKAAVPNCRP